MDETPPTEETPRKPAKRLIQSRYWRGIVGSALVVVIYAAVAILWTHQSEQQVITAVKFARAQVVVGYSGPTWLPQCFRDQCPVFNRVHEVAIVRKGLPVALFPKLGSLSAIKRLRLYDSDVMDIEIQHLKGLASLQVLDLSHSSLSDVGVQHITALKNLEHLFVGNTKISDVGLRQLSALPNLKSLDLRKTDTTEEGREQFRKVLPNCLVAAIP